MSKSEVLKLLLWRLGIEEEIELSDDAFPTVKAAALIRKKFEVFMDGDKICTECFSDPCACRRGRE